LLLDVRELSPRVLEEQLAARQVNNRE
jgi:hypothetical protein